ncbi:MAG: phosphoenolpyruvate carboxykinase (GTP), partial [Ruminococcus sp.]|nr:phosphoenolpyruvate carboxykinase (GTP) [Ruminococcus sp.]
VLGDKAPKIFNVNWFRLDDDGNFLWPGFGDNFRVLEWIVARCNGEANANETAIGYVPSASDINLEGLDMDIKVLEDILYVDNAKWLKETEGIEEFYQKFGDRLPEELKNQLAGLKERLSK